MQSNTLPAPAQDYTRRVLQDLFELMDMYQNDPDIEFDIPQWDSNFNCYL